MASVKIAAAAAGLAALTLAASAPAEAQYRRGWSPGAAAAVGILGGMAAGAAIASTARPAYGAPPVAYYAPPPEAYGECYVVHKRVWVPGWGWDVRPREICD
jgi:hypothetical protein